MRINRADFLSRLKAVRIYCGKATAVYGYLRVETIPGGLAMEAMDEWSAARAVVVGDAPEDEDWATIVDPKSMEKVLGAIRADTVEASLDDGRLVISAGTTRVKMQLPSLPSEWPAGQTPPFDVAQSVTMDLVALHASLAACLKTTSDDECRGLIRQIKIDARVSADEPVTMVATDGHRLTKVTSHMGWPWTESIGLHKTSVCKLVKTLADKKCTGLRVAKSETRVMFANGVIVVWLKEVHEPFAKWQSVVPERFDMRLLVDRSEALEAVALAKQMASGRNSGIKLEPDNGALKVVTDDCDGAQSSTSVAATWTGGLIPADYAFGVNADYLHEALDSVDWDRVELSFGNDPLGAMAVRHPEHPDDHFVIIMPLRL